jgi:hypothetical protein
MAQFARPFLDVTRTDWEEDDGTTVAIFDQIDESAASDADFIRTGAAPSNAIFVCKLSPVVDPVASTGHIVRYRYKKDAAGGDAVDLLVELRQGYVSEGTPGTLIEDAAHADIGGASWTDGSFTLDAAEADAITNYADLYLRFVATTP